MYSDSPTVRADNFAPDLCRTCGHPLSAHDAISLRWCAASELGGENRACICSGVVQAARVLTTTDLAPVRKCGPAAFEGGKPVRHRQRRPSLCARQIAGTFPGSETSAGASRPGLGRAITGLPALARFAPRPLFLDLADQVSTHLREGMIKVALVGGGHEVRPSR
jgi:hypothetical protein